MIDHEVVRAIAVLAERGALSEAQASVAGRAARRELVTVRLELRSLLGAGVLLVAGGAGLLVKTHYDRIGPAAVAAALFGASVGTLAWVARRSPPFSRGPVPSPGVAFDPILLLGVLLLGSSLAWVEAQFHTLGPAWPYHLLLLAVLYAAAAFRFDSRAVLSLALTSFAAWRGVDARLSVRTFLGSGDDLVRWNAVLSALLFFLAAWLAVRKDWKAHFEPVFTNLGLPLLLGALLSGALQGRSTPWLAWEALLAVAGSAAALLAWKLRRPIWFGMAIVALYLGFLRLFLDLFQGAFAWLVVAATSLALVLFLSTLHRRMKEEA